jgi:hypothetical protein
MAIDKALRKAIDAGRIPGIVAMAADDRGILYEGASDGGRSTGLNQ